MKKFFVVFGVVIAIVVLIVVGNALQWFGEAKEVAHKEFNPQAMLDKYMWFIDQRNRVDKMNSDIEIFQKRISDIDTNYAGYGKNKAKWPPYIQVQYNTEKKQAADDLAAIISQRNNLVRDYNSQSQKFNWAPFETRSDMPPKELQEYKTQ